MDPEIDVRAKMEDEKSIMIEEKEVKEAAPCTSNANGNLLLNSNRINEHKKRIKISLDTDVNIVDCLPAPPQDEKEETCTDSNDSLSSFDESDVSIGEKDVESPSEPNVEESDLSVKVRKNRLTEHWKNFIRPLMWRAKWLELQLKELRGQTLKYDKAILDHEGKKFNFGSQITEQFNARTSPFSDCFQPQKIMKRIKRKKCEEDTEFTSYITHHNIFSYLGDDSLNIDISNVHTSHGKMYNKRKEACEDDMWDLINPKEDASEEVEIFTKIEAMQTRVKDLISRVDKMVNELSDHSSINSQSLPDQSDQLSCPNPFAYEESSFGDATPLSHIFESMAMQNVPFESEAEEQILINNEAAEEEMKNLRNFGLQCSDNSHEQSETSDAVLKKPRRTKGIIHYRRKNT